MTIRYLVLLFYAFVGVFATKACLPVGRAIAAMPTDFESLLVKTPNNGED